MSNEDKIIADVNSLMTMEGMSLTAEDKSRISCFLSNPDTLENMINNGSSLEPVGKNLQ